MPKNPIVVIIDPAKIILYELNFDIIKPKIGPKIRDMIENERAMSNIPHLMHLYQYP